MARSSYLAFLLLFAAACVPLGTPITDPNAARRPGGAAQPAPEYYADRTLRYQDYIYDPNVRTVQCYVASGSTNEIFTPPVVPITQEQPITLEFDIVGEQSQRLTAKLLHCDVDWKPSNLTDMQFLSEINEFLFTNYRTSVNTKVPYFHYRLQVPRVKLSGNYLLVVQGAGNTPLLSRRLLVYENGVQISLKQGLAGVELRIRIVGELELVFELPVGEGAEHVHGTGRQLLGFQLKRDVEVVGVGGAVAVLAALNHALAVDVVELGIPLTDARRIELEQGGAGRGGGVELGHPDAERAERAQIEEAELA